MGQVNLLLALQLAIIPMTLDSIGATPDSVTYRLAWAYDSTAPTLDSVRVWWGSYPKSPRTWRLARAARTVTLRFAQRRGEETALRTACVRVWRRLVPVLRCVARSTVYLYRIDLKPDSATLTASPPP